VIPCVESVTADLILDRMVDDESVIVILDAGFGADFDILADGSRSDKIRLDGTVWSAYDVGWWLGMKREWDSPMLISGRGNISPCCLLKLSMISLVSSRCCS